MRAGDEIHSDEGAIRFLLDGRVHEVRGIDPTTTVLQYLRENLSRTGTKEGCAEGDCGACTVVMAEGSGERVRYLAINSCIQLLPTLDGKALFTVESLQGADGVLHPVQEAMVQCHASQCGFCTPGFVMSLFALYKSDPDPTRQRIDDALAGNLCRCTGYRPIIDAARHMYRIGGKIDGVSGEGDLAESLRALGRRNAMRLDGRGIAGHRHRFFAPRDVRGLLRTLARHPRAFLLAGGTDLGLWVTKEHRDLDPIVYLGHVEKLKRVTVTRRRIELGAMVSLTDAAAVLADLSPDLGELYRRFASPPIRNSATLVGNIANGSPIGDSLPALLALDASIVLRSSAGSRELPLRDFYLGYRETALAPGEFIECVRVPVPRRGRLFRVYKLSKRFDQDISGVCGAFALELEGGRVVHARLAYGGMAATAKRAVHCERALLGQRWDESTVEAAAGALQLDYRPITDARATSRYRRLAAANLLRRFHLETSGSGVRTRILEFSPS